MLVGLAPRKPKREVGMPDEPDGVEPSEDGCRRKGRLVWVDVVDCWLSHRG